MNNLIILLIVGIIGAIILLNSSIGSQKSGRLEFLKSLAKFLESELNEIEGMPGSFRIRFRHKGRDFVYEDIEDHGFREKIYKGILKTPLDADFTLDFTERSRATLFNSSASPQDPARPWLQNTEKVLLPDALREFDAHSNDPRLANALIADDHVVKTFARYKNIDSRGHPVMSLEVLNGAVILEFHPGGLRPSLFDLRSNVSSVEEYADRMMVVAERISQLKES